MKRRLITFHFYISVMFDFHIGVSFVTFKTLQMFLGVCHIFCVFSNMGTYRGEMMQITWKK